MDSSKIKLSSRETGPRFVLTSFVLRQCAS